MARSSYQTYLMIKEGLDYEKLIDIKNYPDLDEAIKKVKALTEKDEN